jgi:hypothetical protein
MFASVGIHHYIGRYDFADTFFDGIAQRMDLFETGGASDTHGGIDKMTISGAADTHAIDIQDAFHAGHRASDLLTEAFWCGIHESVKGAPAKPRPNPENHACNRQTGDGIGVHQPGQIPGLNNPNQSSAVDDE